MPKRWDVFVALVLKLNVQVKCASPSSAALLSRFENAPEFVPRKAHNPNQAQPKLKAPEPKPERLQVITARIWKKLILEFKDMSFEEFRNMAKEMRSSEKQQSK